MDNGDVTEDWSRYWRSAEQPLEAMYAHFARHVYHRHSHETYSFGVTDSGAQTFTCRGAAHTSAAGMVMAFNPDDPHDGHAADASGFTYRMIHIGPELVTGVLADVTDRRIGRPLFAEPVIADPVLARGLRALHAALLASPAGRPHRSGGAPATALRRDELLTTAVAAIVRRAAAAGELARPERSGELARVAALARRVIRAAFLDDITAGALAAATGRSRFTVYRAFTSTYGMAPSDYQRELRLREARRLLAGGLAISDVAARTGFADQGHLTRWFGRYYGITPGGYRSAVTGVPAAP
ncbi:MAG TPA: AraC family transcriptional regulator [Streptosporangiaceae bacterium]